MEMKSTEMNEIEQLWDRVYKCEMFHECNFLNAI